jgi:hypothetical protein
MQERRVDIQKDEGIFNKFSRRTGIGWSRPPNRKSMTEIRSKRERAGARGRALTSGSGRSATGEGRLADQSGPAPGGAGNWRAGPRGRARGCEPISVDPDRWIGDGWFRWGTWGFTTLLGACFVAEGPLTAETASKDQHISKHNAKVHAEATIQGASA